MNFTKAVYLSMRALDTPLWAIYNLLPIILYKELGASPLQLALVIALKPVVSLFSVYWSVPLHDRPDRLLPNITVGRLLGILPFFFVPFISSPWFFIFASALFMTMAVGMVPAWMEILKRQLPDGERKKTFAYGSTLGYLGGGMLPFFFGNLLDSSPGAWRWIFPAAAFFSLIPLILQLQLRLPQERREPKEKEAFLLRPWREAARTLKQRPDFLKFQSAFMVMGTGLMLMQPALPIYFVDVLKMTYTEMAIALAFCKGIAYAASSPLWARVMAKIDIYRFNLAVSLIAVSFPLMLLFAKGGIGWVFAAYTFYGITQAGSELSWNMSGPAFAGSQNSVPYSAVNVLSVGLRGLFAPLSGSLLCTFFGAAPMMGVGIAFFLSSAFLYNLYSRQPHFTAEALKIK